MHHDIVVGVRVHPRTGGEQWYELAIDGYMLGSSPHGRGADVIGTLKAKGVGFIPARAGSRYEVVPLAAGAWVHPRTGGEQAN